jgi:hypothetical protein
MVWSLDYFPPQEPEYLDRFFLSVGKSLYLASEFELKCQQFLNILKIATHFKKTKNASACMELAKALKDKLLGPALKELKGFPGFTSMDIAKLERAKDARNFIAHESANIGALSFATEGIISERIVRLRTALSALVTGDNLISAWMYEICEKEHAPHGIHSEYPEWVSRWVFGD